MRSVQTALVVLVATAAFFGCGRVSQTPRIDGRTDVTPQSHPPADNGNAPTDASGGRTVRVLNTDGGSAVCGADLAATTFRFALCACDDADFAATVRTSAYSSSDPAATPGGGGLAANGSIGAAGDLHIEGTLSAAGGLASAGTITVRDDLRVGGDFDFAGQGTIGHDAYLGGDLFAAGMVVAGTVHANDDALVLSAGVLDSAVVREPVSIDPPCACGDDQRTDVAGIVLAAQTDNDNASAGLDAAALTDIAGDIELSLPAGRFAIDGIRAAGAVRVSVAGPAALFINGDVVFAGAFEVVLLDASASLDVFINGAVDGAGAFDLGSAASPSRVRMYVAGAGDIALAGDAHLGASLYAPASQVSLAGDFTFDGAIVAGGFSHAGSLTVRYDADVLDGAGTPCSEDGADTHVDGDGTTNDSADVACATAADCGNQACVDGVCGACSSALECAAPLVCNENTCIPLPG